MRDPETLETRRRKRIVEFVIAGFNSADEAVSFGSAIKKATDVIQGNIRVDASIASPTSVIAITDKWIGDTVLKLGFYDIPCQNDAWFIVEQIRYLAKESDKIVMDEITREKPQPQTITLEQIPSSLKLFNVG